MIDLDGLRVLIAPDCYGDSLTAVEAAEAIAAGWRRARPGDQLTLAPQSDGGPGFVDVLAGRLGERRTLRVIGPLTEEVDADWVCDDAEPRTAYIECAQACGLALLGGPPTVETALAAHSRGVGQLIAAAVAAGARRIVVGLGGSSCTDGGRGMIDELAAGASGAGQSSLEAAKRLLADVELIAATDVEHPLLGPMGAARVFGPQKGADPDTVLVLEQRLTDWAVELDAAAGRAVSTEPGAGAAGGLGAALLALGGRRESGATVIAEHTHLSDDVAAAQLVITGEGRFDDQSLHGKVVSALAGEARGTPVLVLAGQVTLAPDALREAGITAAHAIADHAGSVQLAMDDAENQLAGLAQVTADQLGNSGTTRYR
ncbi:glycerate kinase [Mycolicibacterium moriokaense]|nr:glycerate kinase [Mycolicibacterium moriokaense]